MISIRTISYGRDNVKVSISLNGISVELPCKNMEKAIELECCLKETIIDLN